METIIKQIKDEYQQKLNEEYRRVNKGNPMLNMLSEEEITGLNPLTDEIFIAMLASEKINIINKKAELEKEISEDKALIDDPRTRSEATSELRYDVMNNENRLRKLDARYLTLSDVYSFLRNDENRDSTKPSR